MKVGEKPHTQKEKPHIPPGAAAEAKNRRREVVLCLPLFAAVVLLALAGQGRLNRLTERETNPLRRQTQDSLREVRRLLREERK